MTALAAMRNRRENQRKRWHWRTTRWKTMNVTSLTFWKSYDVIPNASFTRHDVSPIALSTPSCVSAPRIGLIPPVPHCCGDPDNCCREKLTSTAHFCCCNQESIWATLPESTLTRQHSTWEYIMYVYNMTFTKRTDKMYMSAIVKYM
jgi:hypothetical protein